MQVKEIKSEGLNRELEVVVPLKEIEGHVETRLREVGKNVRLPGFRPGKVPLDILKKRYGRAIFGEVLEKAVNESSAKALKQQNIRASMQPKIEVQEFDEGKDLTYRMTVEVLPDIAIMDLTKLSLEKPVAKVDDETVTDTLKKIAQNNSATKKVEEDRPAKSGDTVSITFHGRTKDDGKEHPGMHMHGHKLLLGSGQFIPGFEDQLIGKKVGDSVEVNVTFPAQYGAKELAGRDAVFDVDIEGLFESAPAEVNDELAKSMGYESVDTMKEAVIQHLQGEYDTQSRLKLKRTLLDQLDENHDIEAPARMAEAEYEGIMQQIKRERDMNPEAEELSDEDKEDLKDIAARRVRLGLVLSEIGTKNKITVSDKELQQAVIREAQKFPGQERAVFEFYQKNPQALESMRAPIFEDKVVDFILSQAKISEKTVSYDELIAEDEEDLKPKKKAATKKSSDSDKEAKPKKTKSKKAE